MGPDAPEEKAGLSSSATDSVSLEYFEIFREYTGVHISTDVTSVDSLYPTNYVDAVPRHANMPSILSAFCSRTRRARVLRAYDATASTLMPKEPLSQAVSITDTGLRSEIVQRGPLSREFDAFDNFPRLSASFESLNELKRFIFMSCFATRDLRTAFESHSCDPCAPF